MEENKKDSGNSKDIEENKLIAAIGYVWILCLVPLLLKRDSKYAQFHGKQGLVLFIVEIIGWLVYWIPLVGWFFAMLILVFAIIGFIKALSGEYWEMPIIGGFAKKLNL
jgi:fumarate reductase subunit D